MTGGLIPALLCLGEQGGLRGERKTGTTGRQTQCPLSSVLECAFPEKALLLQAAVQSLFQEACDVSSVASDLAAVLGFHQLTR